MERVNLTTCLGASLVNTLFVMDEPSVGLHPRDIGRLDARDEKPARQGQHPARGGARGSDHSRGRSLVEIGPGRGEQRWRTGLSADPLEELWSRSAFVSPRIISPAARASRCQNAARRHALRSRSKARREHNLQNLDVEIPLGVFACVTGVSGSGKITLVHDVLYQNLLRARGEQSEEAGACKSVTGAHRVGADRDGRSIAALPHPALHPDSLPRRLRSHPRALRRAPGVHGARPDRQRLFLQFRQRPLRALRRHGFEKIEMQFLSDLFVRCPECEGKRYQPHMLKVKLEGRSIHDVLELTVSEAMQLFHSLGEDKALARAARDSGGSRSRLPALGPAAQYPLRRRIAAAQARQASHRQRRDPTKRGVCSSSTSRPPACISTTSRCSLGCFSGWSSREIRSS